MHVAVVVRRPGKTLEGGMLGHGMSMEEIDNVVTMLNGVLEKTFDSKNITLTKKAADKFREILKQEDKEGYGLRVAEKAGGCGGAQYILDFLKIPSRMMKSLSPKG